jgi:hypothetical protein
MLPGGSTRNPSCPGALAGNTGQPFGRPPPHPHGGTMLKFLGGTIGVIFLIGLLVVIGVLSLIF